MFKVLVYDLFYTLLYHLPLLCPLCVLVTKVIWVLCVNIGISCLINEIIGSIIVGHWNLIHEVTIDSDMTEAWGFVLIRHFQDSLNNYSCSFEKRTDLYYGEFIGFGCSYLSVFLCVCVFFFNEFAIINMYSFVQFSFPILTRIHHIVIHTSEYNSV